MTRARALNRGPKAAAGNRAALIAAAREVFADIGFDAPLSLIARTAGVGQGSLYRHFPDRESIALAVFEENIAILEAAAAEPNATLDDILKLILEQVVVSIGFIEMIAPGTADARLVATRDRMKVLLAAKLESARIDGWIRAELTVEDLLLALAMFAALLARTDAHSRRVVGERAWMLLRDGLAG